ncbi:hypothetical protein ACA910_019777 [Epithemia clementina (nom. ined.)]
MTSRARNINLSGNASMWTAITLEESELVLESSSSSAHVEDVQDAVNAFMDHFHVFVMPLHDCNDKRTLWTIVLKHAGKLAQLFHALLQLTASDYHAFQQRSDRIYESIIHVNLTVASMLVRLIRLVRNSSNHHHHHHDGNGAMTETMEYENHEVFLSHAGEQKEGTIRPLYQLLKNRQEFDCFFDEDSLLAGDSISEEIQKALVHCSMGFVLLTREFLTKKWPVMELLVLCARWAARGDDDDKKFQLVMATQTSSSQEQELVIGQQGWPSWFDQVKALPLPWRSFHGMPVTIKLVAADPDDQQRDVRRLADLIQALMTKDPDSSNGERAAAVGDAAASLDDVSQEPTSSSYTL